MVSVSAVDSYYDRGDFIPAYTLLNNETAVQAEGGHLSVPQADFTGRCNPTNFAQFEMGISGSFCSLQWPMTLPEFSTQCGMGRVAVSTYAEELFVLTTP